MRTTLIFVVMAAAMSGLVGCSGGTITVPANSTWTDTGVRVARGQNIIVSANGEVFANPTLSCDPAGFANKPEWRKYSVIPAAPHVALIGKIGAAGPPFLVGRSFSGIADRDGELFLGVNDKDTSNNKGGFAVKLEIH
jgi:hypothetical protein